MPFKLNYPKDAWKYEVDVDYESRMSIALDNQPNIIELKCSETDISWFESEEEYIARLGMIDNGNTTEENLALLQKFNNIAEFLVSYEKRHKNYVDPLTDDALIAQSVIYAQANGDSELARKFSAQANMLADIDPNQVNWERLFNQDGGWPDLTIKNVEVILAR